MSDGSATLPTSTTQGRGCSLALYEAAAAEVSNDNDGSAIIHRIMAIAAATASGGASKTGAGEEEDNGGDEGVFVDTHSGPDEDGTVLGGPDPHIGVDHASGASGRSNMVRPLLIPTEDYPPAGSAMTPIDVDNYDHHSPIDINAAEPSGSSQDWALDIDRHHSPPSSPVQSDSSHTGDGPITHCYDHEKDSRWVSNVYYSAWIDYTWTMTYT